MGISFSRSQEKIPPALLKRPMGSFATYEQAGGWAFFAKAPVRGLALLNFKADLPFHAMMRSFGALQKRSPWVGRRYFQSAKLLQFL